MALNVITRKEAAAKGLKTYFTGSSCNRGHVAKRYVSSWGCVECERIRRLNNKARIKRYLKEYYQDHREQHIARSKKYYQRNAEWLKAYIKEHRQGNQARKNVLNLQRVEYIRRATPTWVSLREIEAFYHEAQRISQETGTPHHVDHIVPLQGYSVSGLHVPWNLRVIPAIENICKGNQLVERLL